MGKPLSHPFWKVLGAIVLLSNLSGILFGVVLLAQPKPALPAPAPDPAAVAAAATAALHAVKEEAEKLKIQFDYWEKRATQVQFLVGLMLAINSLYAFALAAGTYVNLKSVLESARREVDDLRTFASKARTDLEEFRSEIRSDLPTLQNMDKALRNILAELRRLLPTDRDWAQAAYYASLSLAEREQIRYAELTVAGFQFFELGRVASFRSLVAEIYRGLGQFYGSYYLQTRAAVGGPDQAIYERSLLYFEEARTAQPDKAQALKDMGVLYTRMGAGAPWSELARQAFEQSLQIDSAEPGALFGLGWLEYLDQNWTVAIRSYSAIIAKKEWTEADRRKYLPDSYLNRACCRARSLAPDAVVPALDTLIADCEASLKIAKEVEELAAFRPRLKREFETGGDLAVVGQKAPDRVKKLLA